jgi:hypothetical protein
MQSMKTHVAPAGGQMTMAPRAASDEDADHGRRPVPQSHWSSIVTASTNITPVQPRRSGLSTATQAVVGTAFALFLALIGITFVALAAAFPIVVPMIQDQHLPVSARDFEMAKAFASVWWIFAGVGVATLVAALVTAVKLVQHLDPQPSE